MDPLAWVLLTLELIHQPCQDVLASFFTGTFFCYRICRVFLASFSQGVFSVGHVENIVNQSVFQYTIQYKVMKCVYILEPQLRPGDIIEVKLLAHDLNSLAAQVSPYIAVQ